MPKEYTVYSQRLAQKLRNQGFRQIRTEPNKTKPQFKVFVFENSTDLQCAISYLTKRGK